MRTSKDERKRDMSNECSHPGCAEDGLIKVEGDKWLCSRHITERINSPESVALTEADAELEKFRHRARLAPRDGCTRN